MRYLSLAACIIASYCASAQNSHYSHARELGFVSKPKSIVLNTYEARPATGSSYERAARKPYSTQVISFDDKGRVTERVEYYFNTVQYDKDDTVSVTKRSYEYDAANRPTVVRQYLDRFSYTYTTRTWTGDKQYTDSVWTLYINPDNARYNVATEKKGKLVSTSTGWLNDDYKNIRTSHTLYYKLMTAYPQNDNEPTVNMRPFDPPAVYDAVDEDQLVFDKKDTKGNMTVAVYKTSADKQAAEYLQEEYSYEYY
ncbi:hypothetical protein CAP35_12995 [Chitinophagaceae bacterium IBVUCB1]|nr:hypothetical protein CAP35_12995 [Chitinophagaceae bacterium IBVUCB1]